MAESLVCPGQRLEELGPFGAGEGTYIHKGKIYASIVGQKKLVPVEGNVGFRARG